MPETGQQAMSCQWMQAMSVGERLRFAQRFRYSEETVDWDDTRLRFDRNCDRGTSGQTLSPTLINFIAPVLLRVSKRMQV